MNKVILMGRLVADPEMRYTQGAKPTSVCRYRIAVPRQYKRDDREEADFFTCVSFAGRAEFVCKYFRKGSMIAVVGRVENREYNSKDGDTKRTTEIMVEEQFFCGDKGQKSEKPSDDFTAYESDDDLPFDV